MNNPDHKMTPEQITNLLAELKPVSKPTALRVRADTHVNVPPDVKNAVEVRDSQQLLPAAKPRPPEFYETLAKRMTPEAFAKWKEEERQLLDLGFFPISKTEDVLNRVDGTFVVEIRNNVITEAYRMEPKPKLSFWGKVKAFFKRS